MTLRPLLFTLAVLMGGWATAEPRFRADDGNLWRLDDNPATAAASGDKFALGYAVLPTGGSWARLTQDLQLISPFLEFHYTWRDADSTLRLGTEVGPWQGLSFGYRADVVRQGNTVERPHNFGLLWRPLDAVSAAVTVDDAFGPARLWGAGLALRPGAFFGWDDGLTLTADASATDSSVAWERWGGRWSWQGSDVRVWYEAATSTPGVEVTLALGPAETTGSWNRAGQALRWSTRTPELSAFGPLVLRIKGRGVLDPSPTPAPLFALTPARANLPELLERLDRAAASRRVAAVVFDGPPEVDGLAAAEQLGAALDKLHAAGKKVYVHGDSYPDSLGFQGWIARADRVSLDPNGSLELRAGGSRRLYLKGLLDKLGIEVVNLAPWETKSANNTLSFASMPDGERAMLTRFLSDRDDLASASLAQGRGGRLQGDAGALVAAGPYLSASEALSRGLVDALENQSAFDDAVDALHPGATIVDELPALRSQAWGPEVATRAVALVDLAGDIVLGPGQPGRSIGSAAAATLKALRTDSSIRAVVLRVNSPGGAVLPSDALADEVRRTVAAGKPVVVVMGDLAASGGYYLSAPASRIFALPGTLTGSIGVTAALVTAGKALDLLGIHPDGVDTAPSAASGDWTRPTSPDDLRKWQAQIDSIYQRFLGVVAQGRHLDLSVLEPLARGQIYTGREALALGLVDELGGLDEAKQWLEAQLGGKVAWKPYLPGENDTLGGLLAPLANAVVAHADSPALRLAARLDALAAPWSEALAGMAARGAGPQVWTDVR
jgi:protease-4